MKKYISKWLDEGLINAGQAKQMLSDVEKTSSQSNSNKIIYVFSTIGAAFVGVGLILFTAANWQAIPSIVKILMFMGLTFASAFSGYYLEYVNKIYPKTGSSLIFLSAILFGALIFLLAQIYHTGSNEGLHWLVLIWMVSILPYIYIFYSRSVSYLVCALLITWFSVFIFTNNDIGHIMKFLPALYYLSGIFLFSFGKANEFIKDFSKTSDIFEKSGFFVIMLSLFILTFSFSYFTFDKEFIFFDFMAKFKFLPVMLTPLIIISSVFMFLASFFFNPAKKNNLSENILITAVLSFCILILGHSFMPKLVTNLFFAAITLIVIFTGYTKKEMFYTALGIFWLIIFMIVKYFDIFWDLLPRSVFFIAGGIILVSSALFFERKRKNLKTEIKVYEP